jgi:hypothetical protein
MEETTMKRQQISFLRLGLAMLVGGAGMLVGKPALANGNWVVSVEEHWELQVGEPDTDRSSPQTTMVMSPTNDLGGTHFLFTLNHAPVPDYHLGGMQVQVWNGDSVAQEKAGSASGSLANTGETVSWTQRISLQNGTLTFAVVDGQSATWPTFGADGDLSVSVGSSLQNLNGYRPAVSLGESQVSYAENRVTSLVLKKLVWVTADGTVHEQNAPIPIDTTVGE